MADAWGGSWGVSWGVSWGSGVTPPVVVTGSIPGGLGYPVMPEPRKKRPKEVVPAYQVRELVELPPREVVPFDDLSEITEILELIELTE